MDKEHTNPLGQPIAPCESSERCAVVSCHVCLSEVPADVALTAEGPDYVQYFCGLECLEKWQARAEEAHAPKSD